MRSFRIEGSEPRETAPPWLSPPRALPPPRPGSARPAPPPLPSPRQCRSELPCSGCDGERREDPWPAARYVGEGKGAYMVLSPEQLTQAGPSLDAAWSALAFKVAPFTFGAFLMLGLVCAWRAVVPRPQDSAELSQASAPLFSCSGSTASWASGQADWCCRNHGRGCEPVGVDPPDCVTGFSRWRELWSPEKQQYCCEHQRVACADWPGDPTSDAAPPSTTTEFHDCQKDFPTWSSSWDGRKKAWCCQHERVGCPTLRPTAAPASLPAPPPEKPSVQRRRPPLTAAVPPPPPLPSASPAAPPRDARCESVCNFGGTKATCTGRIQSLVRGKFGESPDACSQALDEVFRDCPMCIGCSSAVAHCTSSKEYDCSDEARAGSAWSSDERRWCCLHRGVAAHASAASMYDCSEDWSDWQHKWGLKKKAFCCIHAGKACPPKDAMAQLPFSEIQYDCEEGLSRWETEWSVAKRAWCCITHKKGCDQ